MDLFDLLGYHDHHYYRIWGQYARARPQNAIALALLLGREVQTPFYRIVYPAMHASYLRYVISGHSAIVPWPPHGNAYIVCSCRHKQYRTRAGANCDGPWFGLE